MWIYFRSRGVPIAATLIVVATAAGIPLRRVYSLVRDGYEIAFPLGLLATVAVAVAFVLTLSGRFEQFEALGSRSRTRLRAYHAVGGLLAVSAVSAIGVVVSHSFPPLRETTVGAAAPVRAVLGMLGLGLAVSAVLDIRIAAAFPLSLPLLPIVFNPDVVPGGDVWGFVLAPAHSITAWVAAVVLCLVGTLMYVFGYRDRVAPALSRSRSRRRRLPHRT